MTTVEASPYGEPNRGDAARWILCLLVVLGLHAALVAALLVRSESAQVAESLPPAVYVDLPAPNPIPALQPAPAAPPATPVEPMPPAEIAEPTPPPKPVAETRPEPLPEPPPPPERTAEARPKPLLEPPLPTEAQPVEAPAAQAMAEVAVPPPPPSKPEPPKREPPREARPAEPRREARAQPAAPAEAPRGLALRLQPSLPPAAGLPSQTPPAPEIPYQPGSSTRTTSTESFQRRLIAHLARYKRYPQSARMRREEGVVRVRFTMDAQGYLLSTSIVQSSGYRALDREVEDLLRRAQPLPPLPPETGLNRFQVEMPVQFYIWESR